VSPELFGTDVETEYACREVVLHPTAEKKVKTMTVANAEFSLKNERVAVSQLAV
jgi:hypothetical protein